jgi:hypothetical protein
MSDRLSCPDCGGTGETRLGPLRFLCRFCRGFGYVGDDNEPATRNDDDGDEVDPMATTPVWEDPAARALPGCPQCLGTGRVIGLGGDVRGGAPSKLVEAPCPACST